MDTEAERSLEIGSTMSRRPARRTRAACGQGWSVADLTDEESSASASLDDEQDVDSSSSFEPAHESSAQTRKKVGRPIAYQGDPESPHLTEAERRRIKRRIANRESARRVRHRRQLTMQELQSKIKALDKHNAVLLERVNGMGTLRVSLEAELQDIQSQLEQEHADGKMLHSQLTELRCYQAHLASAMSCEGGIRAEDILGPHTPRPIREQLCQQPAYPGPH